MIDREMLFYLLAIYPPGSSPRSRSAVSRAPSLAALRSYLPSPVAFAMGTLALLLATPAALRTPRLRAMPAAHAGRLRSPVRLLASAARAAALTLALTLPLPLTLTLTLALALPPILTLTPTLTLTRRAARRKCSASTSGRRRATWAARWR